MATVSRLILAHPALGTAGGAALHTAIEDLWKKVGDAVSSRWFQLTDFDNGESVDCEHNFGTALANLRYDLYVANGINEETATVWPSGASAAQGDYLFLRAVDGTTFALWLNKDGVGTPPTGAYYLSATHKIQVDILSGDSAAGVALKARNAAVASVPLTSKYNVGARSVDTFGFIQLVVGDVVDGFTKNANDSGAGSITATTTFQGTYGWTLVTDTSVPALSAFTFAATFGNEYAKLTVTNVSGGNNLLAALVIHNDPIGLDELTDVQVTAPAAGHVLRHDGTKFVNALPTALGAGGVEQLNTRVKALSAADQGKTFICFSMAPTTFTFDAAADVDPATDLITEAAHGITTGQPIVFSHAPYVGGSPATTMPSGLAAGTVYYAIAASANTLKVATSYANALAGTGIDITADGSGTITMTAYRAVVLPPSSVPDGYAFTLKNNAASSPFFLVRPDATAVEGVNDDMLLSADYGRYTFIWMTSQWWRIG